MSKSVVATTPIRGVATGVAAGGGGFGVASVLEPAAIYRIDPATNRVVATIATGHSPTGARAFEALDLWGCEPGRISHPYRFTDQPGGREFRGWQPRGPHWSARERAPRSSHCLETTCGSPTTSMGPPRSCRSISLRAAQSAYDGSIASRTRPAGRDGALTALKASDRKLARLIDATVPVDTKAWRQARPLGEPFSVLVYSIIGQQISGYAARPIAGRLTDRFR